MTAAPKMPEIRATLDLARQQVGREDTESFALVAPGLLAQLVQILDLYVGHEPTLAEEAEYVRQERHAEGSCTGIALNGVHTQVFHCRQTASAHPLHLWRTGLEWYTCQGESTPSSTDPLAIRWVGSVIHPDADPTENTIVCCADQQGGPVALMLDAEHREALGLSLIDPNGEMDQADDGCAGCGGPDCVGHDQTTEAVPDYKGAVAGALRLLESASEAFQPGPPQNISAAAHILRTAHEAGGGQ